MNLRNNLILTLTAALAIPAFAAELSPDDALKRASTSYGKSMIKGLREGKSSPALLYTSLTTDGRPAAYIFSNADEKGYVVISADDSTIPMLGYSEAGSFNPDEMPESMKWWLAEYGRQIEYARTNNLPVYSTDSRRFSRSGKREVIAPMIKTMWDQVAPFNNQCPLSGSERTWTGCVATAMAQVLNYWQFPEKGKGSITYDVEKIEKKVSMDFSKKKFDWENMLDAYFEGDYNQTQADAVAYLMKACGYSVKMQYSMDASGALAMNIGNALTKYFGYDPNLLYTLRQYYSSSQWDDMMYENLKNVGPVLYGGGSIFGGGHSFVCDGYDGEGMYHFNWGWSGMSDGYFALDALNPDALGSGGGSGGGYNFTQDAVFGIQPPTGEPAEQRYPFISQEGELSGSISGSVLKFSLVNVAEPMWVNYNPQTLYVKFGAMFYPQGKTESSPVYRDIYSGRFELQPGYGTNAQVMNPSVNLSSLGLTDGTYKVVIGTVEVPKGSGSSDNDGEGFVEIMPEYGASNYVTLKVNNGKYSVSNDILPPLKVSGEIIGGLYYNCLNRVRLTVENTSDIERTSGFAPVFLDSEGPILLGESIFLTIPPKTTLTREWSTDLRSFVNYIDPYLGQEVVFSFFNEANYDFYTSAFTKTVTLNKNPGAPKVTVTRQPEVTGGTPSISGIIIPDPQNIEVTAQITLQEGYFRYPVVACLCTPAGGGQVEIVTTATQNVFLEAENGNAVSTDLKFHLSYPVFESNCKYYILLAYSGPTGLAVISDMLPVSFPNHSGLDEVEESSSDSIFIDHNDSKAVIISSSGIKEVMAYDAAGCRLLPDAVIEAGKATVKLPRDGVAIIRVVRTDGTVKTFRLR